eukprot:5300909-Alexandrium_andersonii.AAC.1
MQQHRPKGGATTPHHRNRNSRTTRRRIRRTSGKATRPPGHQDGQHNHLQRRCHGSAWGCTENAFRRPAVREGDHC